MIAQLNELMAQRGWNQSQIARAIGKAQQLLASICRVNTRATWRVWKTLSPR